MNPQRSITIPGAIIIAGALVAVALIWSKRPAPVAAPATATNQPQKIALVPVSSADHIFGNPNAPIVIVEYSDASCPFCKAFHPTMQKIMAEYGPSGQVAWVYRHFPLDKADAQGRILHPNAGHEAQAMECAAALGGNDKFWAFTNRLYDVTPAVTPDSPDGLDQKELPNIAKYVGLDPVSFNECLSSNRFKSRVEQEYLDGINAGISGTPYSIVITPSGNTLPLVGAMPYLTVKATIDALISATPPSTP